jgi:glycosyltransferase involved in cell wall biosynthesis
MAKFIVVDPSIIDMQGHYYEYAVRVLKAAQNAGYVAVLATNRRFQSHESFPWEVHRVYKYGFWFQLTEFGWYSRLTKLFSAIRRRLSSLKARLVFSRWGLLWTMRNQLGKYLRYSSLDIKLDIYLLLFIPFVYIVNVMSSAMYLLKEIIPFRGYWTRLFSCLHHLTGTLLYPLSVIIRPKDWMLRWLWSQVKMRQFARDTLRLFQEVRIEQGDIVFFPMVSSLEMTGLLKYFQKDPNSRKATWHLLFRHQLYIDRNLAPALEPLRPIRKAFYQFCQGLNGQQVYFYTDSDDLTEQYNSLEIVPFHTLPIPVSEEFHRLRRPASQAQPLKIAYVGDARKEKGYHYLPRIVQDLWAEYVETGRITFVIQSNFNVPGGTPPVALARAQLQSYPRDKVTLFTEPLTSAEYRDLVISADIILLPYDRDAYYAGSSGILAEALAAGVPCIVPDGVWMAKQFANEVYRYHESLRQKLPVLKSRRGEELRWRYAGDAVSNPMAQGGLSLGTVARPVYTMLTVPLSAELLLFSFGPTQQAHGCIQVYTDQLDAKGASLQRSRALLYGSNCERPSLLLPLLPGVRRIYLDLARVSSKAASEIFDIQVHFLAMPKHSENSLGCPRGAVGLAYNDLDEITDLLREMIEHYAHYRATAYAFSTQWFAKHNAERLVEELRYRAESSNSSLPEAKPSELLETSTGVRI